MGKTIIGEEAFPKIIEQYNSGGKTAAYDYLRSEYGIKHPYRSEEHTSELQSQN